jgi:hypothetical protein
VDNVDSPTKRVVKPLDNVGGLMGGPSRREEKEVRRRRQVNGSSAVPQKCSVNFERTTIGVVSVANCLKMRRDWQRRCRTEGDEEGAAVPRSRRPGIRRVRDQSLATSVRVFGWEQLRTLTRCQ